MNRIQNFRNDAEYCLKSEVLALSPYFVFSDFLLDLSRPALEFQWTSLTTRNVCAVSFTACEDYPNGSILQWTWIKTGRQELMVCSEVLLELLPLFGERLLQHEKPILNCKSENQGAGDGVQHCESHCEIGDETDHFAEKRTAMTDWSGERTTTAAEQSGNDEMHAVSDCSEDSDLEYAECESYDDEDEDDVLDDYDFDPSLFYKDKEADLYRDHCEDRREEKKRCVIDRREEKKRCVIDRREEKKRCVIDERFLGSVNSLLKHDIELFRELYEVNSDNSNNWRGQDQGGIQGAALGAETGKSNQSPFLSIRYLESLGEVDCDIHVPLTSLDMSPQLADAWGLFLDEPLVVRVNFNSISYLNYEEQPKVDVFQQKKKDCSIRPQLKNILKGFLVEIWQKVDNDLLKSKLKKCESMPCGLSSVARAVSEDGVHMASLLRLIEMGFGETESRSALLLASNNLMEASVMLANMTSCDETKSDSETALDLVPTCLTNTKNLKGENKRGKLWKRHQSTPVFKRDKKKESMPPRSMSTSHTEPDIQEASGNQLRLDSKLSHMEIKKMPSLEDGFLVMLYKYIVQRVPFVNEFCVICDNPHIFSNGAMLMPSVCSRELCLFSYQSLGVMADTMADIATGADVVDLLITMAKAACFSPRKAIIFTPFPNIVDPDQPEPCKLAISEKEKNFGTVERLMMEIPPMKTLLGSTCTNVSKMLRRKDKLLYPLLNWIIYSNRSHIVKLRPEQQLKIMATPHQFILLSSPPSQERVFQAAKGRYGSTFAFHGSMIENWHSIIRQGLMVASGTKLQLNGAAYGRGIYLSPTATMSASYAGMGHGSHKVQKKKTSVHQQSWDDGRPSRFLQGKNVSCIALCEVIKSPDLKKCNKEIWLCTNEAHVCTRFFFVYEDGQVHSSDVDMGNFKHYAMVEQALAATFMAVVPKASTVDNSSTEDPQNYYQ